MFVLCLGKGVVSYFQSEVFYQKMAKCGKRKGNRPVYGWKSAARMADTQFI